MGLLGHNGAGKSTLFNVLGGLVRPAAGGYRLDGRSVPVGAGPRELAALGVTILHQEPALAANLSVLENLWLAQPAPRSGSRRVLAAEALEKVGGQIDLEVPVATLSLGERQLVALARGLLGGDLRLLLLDEPTAALGQHETESLHRLIRRFAADGVAVVYVSHRLPDILQVCDRIMILTNGVKVADAPAANFTPQRLARALAPDLVEAKIESATLGGTALAIHHDQTTIEVRHGEVVGLFGMAAGEQFALVERAFGRHGPAWLLLDGKEVQVSSPAQAIGLGIHLVPADRERDGLVPGLAAADNVRLPWHRLGRSRGWWIGTGRGGGSYREARERLHILGPEGSAPIDEFSGGNRQKHLLARWMIAREPRILLLAQPTQGVDVGARADIVRAIRELADKGVAVVVASAESDEIAAVCDRAYVLLRTHSAEVPRTPDFDEQLLACLLALAAPAPTTVS